MVSIRLLFSSRKSFLGWAFITISVAVIGAYGTFKISERADPDYQRLRGVIETESESRREAQAQTREAARETMTEKLGRQAAESRLSVATAAMKESERRIKEPNNSLKRSV